MVKIFPTVQIWKVSSLNEFCCDLQLILFRTVSIRALTLLAVEELRETLMKRYSKRLSETSFVFSSEKLWLTSC